MGGVDPSVEEVVVAVWQALNRQEEVYSLLVVPLRSGLLAERDVSNMEAGVLGLFEPGRPWGSLDVWCWPVPGVLRFNNVHLAVNLESHDGVASMGTSSVHDDWVKTVESHDSEIVSRLDGGWVDLDFGGSPSLHVWPCLGLL